MVAADFLLAFDHDFHVERKLAHGFEESRDGSGVDDDARLVVGGPAAVQAIASRARAHDGIKGLRFPDLLASGGLHVVMRVEQERRLAGRFQALAVDVGMGVRERDDLDVFEAALFQKLGHGLRAFFDLVRRKAIEAHARDLHEGPEVFKVALKVFFQEIDRFLHVRGPPYRPSP